MLPENLRRPVWAALLITLAGGVLRILLWDTQPIVSVDGVAHIRMAQQLVGHPAIGSVHQWGYPVFVALAHVLVSDWVMAARVVAFSFGVVLPLMIWWAPAPMVRRNWIRLLPALAMAAHPLAVRYSLTTMTESTYLVALLALFGFYLRGRNGWAGVAGGMAYAVRPEALIAVVFLALVRWRTPRQALLLLAGASLVVAPYMVAQGVLTGAWTLSHKTGNLSETDWVAAERGVGETLDRPVLERVRDHGAETVRAYPSRLLESGLVLIRQGGWWVPVLGVAGVVGMGLPLAGGLLQFFLLPLSFIGARARYLFPSLPFLWMGAAVVVDRVPRPGFRAAMGVLMVMGIALSCWTERSLYTMQEDGSFPELVVAGEWLAPISTRSTVVFDRKPYAAFYAGAAYRNIPSGSYDEVVDDMIRQGGDYLVINSFVAQHWRPALLPLALDPALVAQESRLAPVYYEDSERGLRTIIYRIVRSGGVSPFPSETQMRAGVVEKLLATRDGSPVR